MLDKTVKILFQFLNGTIKSTSKESEGCLEKIFQFLNGTIKSFPLQKTVTGLIYISIPKWYD